VVRKGGCSRKNERNRNERGTAQASSHVNLHLHSARGHGLGDYEGVRRAAQRPRQRLDIHACINDQDSLTVGGLHAAICRNVPVAVEIGRQASIASGH
jgi:hypothetical protein